MRKRHIKTMPNHCQFFFLNHHLTVWYSSQEYIEWNKNKSKNPSSWVRTISTRKALIFYFNNYSWIWGTFSSWWYLFAIAINAPHGKVKMRSKFSKPNRTKQFETFPAIPKAKPRQYRYTNWNTGDKWQRERKREEERKKEEGREREDNTTRDRQWSVEAARGL